MTTTTKQKRAGVFRLTPLSPIHIGSGEKLTPMDYDLHGKQFKVKDVRKYFESMRDDPEAAVRAVQDGLNLGSEFVRYTLPLHGDLPGGNGGSRRPQGRGGGRQGGGGRNQPFQQSRRKMDPKMAKIMKQGDKKYGKSEPPPERGGHRREQTTEVHEFIKDSFGHPYIPGSSLKGCLRTALAYALSEFCPPGPKVRDAIRECRDKRGPKRERIFGDAVDIHMFSHDKKNSATSDVLKALAVRDSQELDLEAAFAVTHVRVMNVMREGFKPKFGMPIYTESLMPEAGPVEVPFYIDLFPLNEKEDRHLEKASKGHAAAILRDRGKFEDALRAFSKALVEHETAFYREQRDANAAGFLERAASDGGILLDLGFGTGWNAKTVGLALDDPDMDQIRRQFRLSKHQAGLFPKTRKWAATAKEGYRPMGWCKLEIDWQ